MNASIITIGDEILIGQIIDTNSAWIAEKLTQIGVSIDKIESISDKEEVIIKTIDNAVQNSELVVLTGGLGPTNDDRTKFALAEYFDTKLVRHQGTYDKIIKMFSARRIPISDINEQQADMPEKCTVLDNNVGSVPGMLFQKDNKYIISVPGVPFEMKYIIENGLLPLLKEKVQLPHIIHKTFLTVGVAESVLAKKLTCFEEYLPAHYSLAYLPSPGMVRLRLSAKGAVNDNIALGFPEVENTLKQLLGEDLFGYDRDTLQAVIGKILCENKLSVSTAESCTGGEIASLITSIPGASKYFKGSVVCYSNKSKHEILDVTEESISQFGAVSKQVVEQLANNVREKFHSDFGVATSGVAGPSGGTEEKPVGTVWIAIASPRTTFSMQYNFGDSRSRTIIRSTLTTLNLLRLELDKIVEKNG